MRLAVALALLAAPALLATAARAQPVRPDLHAQAGTVPFPTLAADSTAAPDDWLAPDKALHLGTSFAATVVGNAVLARADALRDGRALPVAAGGTLVLGLAKELADARRPRHPLFSWRDLAADALGVGLAVAAVAWARD
ncbi:hypothetical protein [Rubrivirga sp. IMCC43871]|uniref:hypothetical protein n=1 Tax=Rubrivirga sp. IMCC43871 TaxID=3391575 RepID=UPI003990004A